jgi:hypothetical protein
MREKGWQVKSGGRYGGRLGMIWDVEMVGYELCRSVSDDIL